MLYQYISYSLCFSSLIDKCKNEYVVFNRYVRIIWNEFSLKYHSLSHNNMTYIKATKKKLVILSSDSIRSKNVPIIYMSYIILLMNTNIIVFKKYLVKIPK